MPCQLNNPANYDLTDLQPHIDGMYDYFDQKLGFHKPPTMVLDSDPSNQSNVLGKTAYYDPSSFEIHIFTDGRHPKDMLRSIAHELIHHHQNLEGRLDVGGYMGEGYYLKNEKMRALEDEAMKKGNGLMREYEDNLKLEEKQEMSLKEWKNNELNQLLLKKWGIIKEEKNVKMVKKDEVPEGAEVVVPDGPGDLVGIKKEEQELNEEECLEEACGDKDYMKEEDEMEEGRSIGRPEGKKDRYVGHEDKIREGNTNNLKESLRKVKEVQKILKRTLDSKKINITGKRVK